MRKILTLITILVASIQIGATDSYSRKIRVISNDNKNGVAVVCGTATSQKGKDEAKLKVIQSFLDTYIFYGVEGLDNGKPIANNETYRDTHEEYLQNLYNNKNKFTAFIDNVKELSTAKIKGGGYSASLKFTVYYSALKKDLKKYKIPTPAVGPKRAPVSLPSIMVVPYKTTRQSYMAIIEKNENVRTAISEVQKSFQDYGIRTVDFQAAYDNALKSGLMESLNASSFDTELIKNSGADVYVTIDIQINNDYYSETGGNLILKAYNTSTSRVLANGNTTFGKRRNGNTQQSIASAIKIIRDNFISDIINNLDEPKTLSLRISIDQNSAITLDNAVDDEGYSIFDYIRKWLRENCLNFHQMGKNAEFTSFDEISISDTDKMGNRQDATDFAGRLVRYLMKLQVNASYRINNETIYITITD